MGDREEEWQRRKKVGRPEVEGGGRAGEGGMKGGIRWKEEEEWQKKKKEGTQNGEGGGRKGQKKEECKLSVRMAEEGRN